MNQTECLLHLSEMLSLQAKSLWAACSMLDSAARLLNTMAGSGESGKLADSIDNSLSLSGELPSVDDGTTAPAA